MGEVYLAEHRHIARRAAIKLLLPELTTKSDVVSRFFTEARATSLIRHPGIVEILDCAVHTNGRAYIIMEFLDGESLAHTLERVGNLAGQARSAQAILGQIASALAAAHAKGIIHRDLKPDNVFLSASAGEARLRVKILDFGIAKLAAEGQSSLQKTRTGSLLGTPVYMSPEQCRGAGAVDHRTDIYSLGCIAYELFAGRPPFVREGAGELLVAHLSEQPRPLAEMSPAVSPQLAALVGRMLAKEPAQRPGSALEVVQAFEALLEVKATAFADLVQPPHGFPALRGTSPAQAVVPQGGFSGTSPSTSSWTPAPAPVARGQAAHDAAPLQVPVGPSGSVVSEPVIGGGTQLLPAFSDSIAEPSPAREPKTQTTLSRTASEAVVTQNTRRRSWRGAWITVGAAAALGMAMVALWPRAPERRHTAPPAHVSTETPTPAPAAPRPAEPVAPAVPDPVFELTSEPSGAEVWTGDESAPRGVTPLKLALPEGEKSKTVTLKAAGYENKDVTLEAGHEGAISVTLAAAKTSETTKVERPTPVTSGPKRRRAKKASDSPYKAMGD